MEYESALARVIDDVVEPGAAAVDRHGIYPRAQLDALGEAGILGLASSPDVGGGGADLGAAASVVEELARHCGSTAMVVMMHFSATAVIEAHGPQEIREAIAAGRHVSTLAFSEAGSRSHFWAPLGTATQQDGPVRLDAYDSASPPTRPPRCPR